MQSTADGGGNFVSSNIMVPFSAINSTITVNASGSMGHSASQQYKVGTYYPVVTPTTFYTAPGSQVGFSATGFAPNEQVAVASSNGVSATLMADGGGNFGGANYTLPNSTGQTVYTFTGVSSHTQYSVTINTGN